MMYHDVQQHENNNSERRTSHLKKMNYDIMFWSKSFSYFKSLRATPYNYKKKLKKFHKMDFLWT